MSTPRKLALGVALGALALFFALRARSRPPAAPQSVSVSVASRLGSPSPAAAPPPPPAAVPATPPPADASPPTAARPPKPAPQRRPEEATADPFVAALVGTTPEAARLNVEYARAHLPVPPEARTLIEMRQKGVPTDELVSYVRTSFPKGILVRGIALRWLGVGAERLEKVRLQGDTAPSSTVVPTPSP